MRDELASTANEPPARITPGLHAERHYSPSELAELWGLSSDATRRIFGDEPGVVTIGERNPRRKRRHLVLWKTLQGIAITIPTIMIN